MAAIGRYKGWLFVAPWVIGLSAFTVYPFCASIYYSFTDFSVLVKPTYVGAMNYQKIYEDDLFWKVLKNTFLYAGLSIPAGLIISLSLALMMNGVRRGQALYSIIFYLPHLMPPVACAILWMWIFNSEFGLLNNALRPILGLVNMSPPSWLGSSDWALPALVVMAMWGVGQTAFIYLAKLQDVPQDMYEAAEIDGASTLQKIWYVTLPMISPVIFFNIIMAIIGSFQVFTAPFMITEGGPDKSTTFMPHYIWDNAFRFLKMGYACAMSWILFLVILALTALAFRLARDRVYYAGK